MLALFTSDSGISLELWRPKRSSDSEKVWAVIMPVIFTSLLGKP
jgi:hypothetical protein